MLSRRNSTVVRLTRPVRPLCAMLAVLLLCNLSSAQEEAQESVESIEQLTAESTEQESPESIEEITVYGTQPIHALRRQVYRAEENFFDVFSSLNDDDEYDVRCFYEIPSFTHIRRHVCRAKFVTEATSKESAPAFSEQVGNFARPARFTIERKKKRLQEIMETLVAEHPELLQALAEYTEKKQILESEKERR